MSLTIFGRQSILPESKLSKIYALSLKELNEKDRHINLIFVSENRIKELNNQYREKNVVTDVLSFVYNDLELYGEIYISSSQIKRQAKEFSNSPEAELIKIFIHGIMHLFGFDHEKEKDALKMESKEEELLAIIFPKL